MPEVSGGIKYIWEHQGRATVIETPPTLNQYETILDETDARVYMINAYQNNTENDAKTINLKMTIDGVDYSAVALSQTDDTWYYYYIAPDTIAPTMFGSTTFHNTHTGTFFEGGAVKIEVRITSANGTAQQLMASVDWAKLKP